MRKPTLILIIISSIMFTSGWLWFSLPLDGSKCSRRVFDCLMAKGFTPAKLLIFAGKCQQFAEKQEDYLVKIDRKFGDADVDLIIQSFPNPESDVEIKALRVEDNQWVIIIIDRAQSIRDCDSWLVLKPSDTSNSVFDRYLNFFKVKTPFDSGIVGATHGRGLFPVKQ